MRAAPVWLLDVNLLIAMTQSTHVHHEEAHDWFRSKPPRHWATCVVTQLAFVRLTSNPNVTGGNISPAEAMRALGQLVSDPAHDFWPDTAAPSQMTCLHSAALVGHRQVTDAYLLGMAAHRRQRLATLDRGLANFATGTGMEQHVELVMGPASNQRKAPLKSRPSSPTPPPGSSAS